MKILLVEDSKFLRLATGRALTRAGYEMSLAGDGAFAFLTKSDLALDQGAEPLLNALKKMFAELPGASNPGAICSPHS